MWDMSHGVMNGIQIDLIRDEKDGDLENISCLQDPLEGTEAEKKEEEEDL
jgi:hypothetical protein